MRTEEQLEMRRAYCRQWRLDHPRPKIHRLCKICGTDIEVQKNKPCQKYCSDKCMREGKRLLHRAAAKRNPEKRRTTKREYERKVYESIITAYGGKCFCCGEPRRVFLNIDHIHGGGNQDRKKCGGCSSWYRWIRRNKFPSTYRLLCANCNLAFKRLGSCPHKDETVGTGIYYSSKYRASQAGGSHGRNYPQFD